MAYVDIADKTTLDSVNSKATTIKASTDKIGSAADTGGTTTAGTVMGKLNKIVTDLADVIGDLDSIGATGDTGGTASTGSVMGKLNAIIAATSGGGGSVIKNIVQGHFTPSSSSSSTGTEISLPNVNVSKTAVFLNGGALVSGSTSAGNFIAGTSATYTLTPTKLTINTKKYGTGSTTVCPTVSYTVIEFN